VSRPERYAGITNFTSISAAAPGGFVCVLLSCFVWLGRRVILFIKFFDSVPAFLIGIDLLRVILVICYHLIGIMFVCLNAF